MNQTAKRVLHIACILGAAIGFQTFFLLCLSYFSNDWSGALYISVLVIGTVLNVALCAVEIIFFLIGKEVIYKAAITAYVLLIFAAIVLFVLLKTGFLEIIRDEKGLEEYLKRAGTWMSILFIALQFLQVVILPIPSFVTVAAGTALFGPFRCAIYSLGGILLGSITAFLIGRYVGHRAVAWMIGEDTLNKWLKKVKGKDKLLLSAMFLLPVFPDDVLCFIAGLSSMSIGFFIGIIAVSRVLAIFTTCYSVTLIPFNTWWGILLWVIFFIAVCVLFVFLYKKSDAIQDWIYRKFHRETRVVRDQNGAEEKKGESFQVTVVDPDGSIVEKSVEKSEDEKKRK